MIRASAGLACAGLVLVAMAYALPIGSLDCSGGGRFCPRLIEAEDGREKLMQYDERQARKGVVPNGALRAAYEGKLALAKTKDAIVGAGGRWEAYGKGPLKASGLAQEVGIVALPDTYLHSFAGRVDNFAYDPQAKRLFASPGTGGIWMSEAQSGDVHTLGDYWISIGDTLPYQANGGVIWTEAGGGTVISAGGDSVMSTGAYDGIGAYWSNDLGITWNHSTGFPDGALVFNTETDPGNPRIVYIASSKGLFRSEDAGRNFANVRLPVGVNGGVDCAGNEDASTPCNLASVVSDVIVQGPGGTGGVICSSRGCPVLAAVGWRAGRLLYPGTEIPQAPANGLYKSDTGEAGSFRHLEPPAVDSTTEAGFAPAERIGRIEMGNAVGHDQDHGYVYALVQDSENLNHGAVVALDPPLDALGTLPLKTNMNGIFMSPDFGESWIRMANSAEVATIPGPYVALIQPGGQSWYDQWIQPDPTRTLPGLGIPTRLVFGLEELFQNLGSFAGIPLNGTAQAGPQDWENIGYYFSASGVDLTTHPDQHAGIFIPTGDLPEGDGGVCLFAGNDGGVFKQCVLPGQPFDNRAWGGGSNTGFYTLLPYGLGVAKDGTVWFGLQDNGSGHIDADTRESVMDFGGDGIYAEVDPDNSDMAYTETPNGGLVRTVDRGGSSTDISPPYLGAPFSTWFQLDPLDGKHMITTANQVFETLDAPTVANGTWIDVYDLGFNTKYEEEPFIGTVADVQGPAIYVGACGGCGITINDATFQNRFATNVGGSKPPAPGTSDGWHDAAAKGLPNRLITAIEIDPRDAKTVYVGLGSYSSPYRDVDSFGEDSTGAAPQAGNLFKSTDAGATFTSIQGKLPSMPVNTILVRDGKLLVGTDFGAFIASDLMGSNWATLGVGLPNVPVTMFKLQPGNPNKLFASTFGRHVWSYEFPPEAQITTARGAADVSRFGGAMPPNALLCMLSLLLLRAGYRRRSFIR